MDYHLHENGWVVILDNFDFNTATQEDINKIAILLNTHGLILARNQNVNLDSQVRLAKMFKDPKPLFPPGTFDYEHCSIEGTDGLVFRITGEKNEHGIDGIAGNTTLVTWHFDPFFPHLECILLMLNSVRGSSGSRTSFNNNMFSYRDLSDELKSKIENLEMVLMRYIDFDHSLTYIDDRGNDWFKGTEVENYTYKLVRTTHTGEKHLFFPFNQISRFAGMTREESYDLLVELREFTTQEKYCYHHDWEDGDIVICDQFKGLHKRWPFDNIEYRLLYRSIFDYPLINYKDEL